MRKRWRERGRSVGDAGSEVREGEREHERWRDQESMRGGAREGKSVRGGGGGREMRGGGGRGREGRGGGGGEEEE